VHDGARTSAWHPDPMGRFEHRDPDGATWADRTSSDCDVTSDPLSAPLRRTSAAIEAESPISWRAAPLPTTESTAAAADSPICWRAAALPITESPAVPSDGQAPGAADWVAASNAPSQRTSRSAFASTDGDTTDSKKDWLIFCGFFAVLIAVDAVVAWLANRA
jgi:hypothetical protein